MPNLRLYLCLFACALSTASCSHTPDSNEALREPAGEPHFLTDIRAWPANDIQDLKNKYDKKAKPLLQKMKISGVADSEFKRLSQYLHFLKIPEAIQSETQTRLFESSTEFLFCEDLTDWACLEAKPRITPLALHRYEENQQFAEPVPVAEDFKIDYYFTTQWYKKTKTRQGPEIMNIPEQAQLAKTLENKIDQNWRKISAALYGIDGIGELDSKTKTENHSMKNIFELLVRHPQTRIVVDVERHQTQADVQNADSDSRYEFQYPMTQSLISAINENQNTENSRVRTEWPAANIMHNKFFVFEKEKQKAVWTGTANISKNCTGDEDFANLAVYLPHAEVADAFLAEFNEMYLYAPREALRSPFPAGRFHKNKRVNTSRYFKFKDRTELRVHFSPTDDGEHRSIIPMLLSARPGDIVRISMFGSAGIEYIRAMQFAAARGAHIKVFLDRDTSYQISNSWINRKSPVRLQEKNPYGAVKGSLEIRLTDWAGGHMNHHKSATLTRKINKSYRPETLIVGSQNWSLAGNDENDENMISIRNTVRGLEVVRDFNEHFDRMLWPTGKNVEIEN